ncbi:putative zinc finger protein [Melghirimyces profundicolus]|uniref:Putative zinc finger protein n=1 Tax=Melghirimyces profundicolus TaxID=1242148 RepID=A0A2T6BG35_9BACL|nr:zf-HC2 domain-containing protein [Melghirimyces profundicolus]PTX55019.1 putative zinc finger protein [Melghirimyces profundicolus]
MGGNKHCDRLRPHLEAFLHDELKAEIREQMAEHLDVCEECRKECEEMRFLDDVLFSALTMESSPSGLTEEILRRSNLIRENPPERDWVRRDLLPGMLGSGLVSVLTLLLGVILWSGFLELSGILDPLEDAIIPWFLQPVAGLWEVPPDVWESMGAKMVLDALGPWIQWVASLASIGGVGLAIICLMVTVPFWWRTVKATS